MERGILKQNIIYRHNKEKFNTWSKKRWQQLQENRYTDILCLSLTFSLKKDKDVPGRKAYVTAGMNNKLNWGRKEGREQEWGLWEDKMPLGKCKDKN